TSIRRSRTRTELLVNLGANLGKQCLKGVLNGRRKNWYGTPRESLRESGEAMSVRHSERPPKGRRR
nr:hypothetical protein [Tanacetum cinerariifolium]